MIAVFWIDWYAYHLARLRALASHGALRENVVGVELVGGCGVHRGLKFREEDRAGLPITTLLPGEDWNGAGQLRLAVCVWRKLTLLRPRVVLVPGYYTLPGFAAALWARLHGRHSILMTETTRADHRRVWCKEIGKRCLLQAFFDSAICGGEPHARYLKALGFSEDRIARCYDVVDNEFFAARAREARHCPALKRKLALPERYFLYVGRFSPEKNVDGFINAFAEYRERAGDWSVVLAGDGPECERLKRRCIDLGIAEAVQFTGLKRTREIAQLYAFAGALVLPSVREPWGLVVNEAMAAGLPVIVSDRCGCAEDLVRHGENGFRFDPLKPGDLGQQLSKLSRLERDTLERMGARSSEIIRDYSLERWADEVARIANAPKHLKR